MEPVTRTTSVGWPATSREYAERVRDHIDRSLDNGLDFRPLAQFLLRGTNLHGNVQHESDGFLTYYDLLVGDNVIAKHISSPSLLNMLEGDVTSQAIRGRLMFLKGYPSAEWLAAIGCTHFVDEELWRRHLGFFANISNGGFTQQPTLPSSTSRTFSLSLTSIGFRGPARHQQSPQHVGKMREEAAASMKSYSEKLRSGRNWNQGDSIVRQHIVHDEEHFSIHQTATIHFQMQGPNDQWLRASYLLLLAPI